MLLFANFIDFYLSHLPYCSITLISFISIISIISIISFICISIAYCDNEGWLPKEATLLLNILF